MIVARKLNKSYGSHKVIDDVSLTLHAGGITSLIGPNGAGKSTLLRVLARLLATDTGEVTLDGKTLQAWDNDELARRLAILRQDNTLSMRLTVQDLVGFGRYPHSKGRLGRIDIERIEAALKQVDLHGHAEHFLDQLSGGQRQRAYIAMVLAQDSDFILLDEPLNGLDLKHANDIMHLLRRLADEHRKTLIIVLHDINMASAWSDRILAMKNGRLLQAGPPSEIMRPEILESVYDCRLPIRTIDGIPTALYWQTSLAATPDAGSEIHALNRA